MEPEGSIDKLKKKLYSREEPQLTRERRVLYQHDESTPRTWSHTDLSAPVADVISRAERSRYFRPATVLILSVAFFALAVAFGAFFYLRGGNVVSAQNLAIDIAGPTTISGGDELTLQVSVRNANATPIQLADLIVEYPDGTRTSGNIGVELSRDRLSIGDIAPGGSAQKTIHAVLFGQERSEKDIKITVEYRVEGSNAIFYKDVVYPVLLSSSPLSITVKAPTETVSGQALSFTVDVTSNSQTPLQNVLLNATYPFGFTFTSASPRATYGSTVWNLGTLTPGDKKSVTLTGVLQGQDSEERLFRFQAGLQSDTDERSLKAAFTDVSQSVTVKKPFISIDLALNGASSDPYVATPGAMIRGDLTWNNNLTVPITDGQIALSFSGAGLNPGSIISEEGFYRSSDNTILWNRDTSAELVSIAPGQSGHFSFSFSPVVLSGGLRNPQIKLSVSAQGSRLSEQNVPESVEASLTRMVKISSDLSLTSSISMLSGPALPKANTESRYRVTLIAKNSANQVGDARVTAALPSYVAYVGSGSSAVSYSQVGGMVTWQIDNLAAGSALQQAVFDISFTPSSSQVGSMPTLVGEQSLSGVDRFTGSNVSATASALTTQGAGGSGAAGVVQP